MTQRDEKTKRPVFNQIQWRADALRERALHAKAEADKAETEQRIARSAERMERLGADPMWFSEHEKRGYCRGPGEFETGVCLNVVSLPYGKTEWPVCKWCKEIKAAGEEAAKAEMEDVPGEMPF